MEELINKLRELGIVLKGLKDDKINEIEKYYGVKLPSDYRLFLKEMGISAGDYLRGEDCFFNRIFELREAAEELLEEDNSSFRLNSEHFVFYVHQGYIFAFIDSAKGNSSPVYFYFEGDLEPTVKFRSLVEFMEERFESMLYYKNLSKIDGKRKK